MILFQDSNEMVQGFLVNFAFRDNILIESEKEIGFWAVQKRDSRQFQGSM